MREACAKYYSEIYEVLEPRRVLPQLLASNMIDSDCYEVLYYTVRTLDGISLLG